jgi:hypothetical protein
LWGKQLEWWLIALGLSALVISGLARQGTVSSSLRAAEGLNRRDR